MVRKVSISSSFFIGGSSIVFLSLLVFGASWIWKEYSVFSEESVQMREQYLESNKQLVKNETQQIIDLIDRLRSKVEQRLKYTIKSRVYEADAIANQLYTVHGKNHSRKEIERLIIDALRPIRYNGGRGYYFITALDGTEKLFPIRPELEGTSMLTTQDTQGRYVVPDMIEIATAVGEGFYRYTWTKPGHKSNFFPKIAFVKRFSPLNWLIGTGEYLDDVDQDIQRETLEHIQATTFGSKGRLFVCQFDGPCLSGSLKDEYVKQYKDAKGEFFLNELQTVATSGGGFLLHTPLKNETTSLHSELFYAAAVDDWKWIVGAEIPIDQIETIIADRKAAMSNRLRWQMAQILLLFLLILTLALIGGAILARMMRNEFALIGNFFQHAAHADTPTQIATDRLHVQELEMIAQSANSMIQQREAATMERNRLSSILEATSDYISMSSLDQEITYMNSAFRTFTGLSETNELSRILIQNLHPPEAFKTIRDVGIPHAIQNSTFKHETYLLAPDHSMVPVSQVIIAHRKSDGSPDYLSTIIRDISEKKETEEALRASEERYRTIFMKSADATVIMDEQFFLDCNDACIELFGYQTKEQIINLPPSHHSPEFQASGVSSEVEAKHRIEEAIENGKNLFDWIHRKANGNNFYAQVTLTPFRFRDKQMLQAVIRDVTALKKAQEEILREQDINKLLIQASPAFIVSIDQQGRTISMNDAMLSALGYEAEEVIGKDYLTTFVPPEDRKMLGNLFQSLLTNSTSSLNENEVVSKSGERLLVEWHGKTIRDIDKKVEFFFGFGIDITERKKVELELQNSRKWLATTLSSVGEAIITTDVHGKITFINPIAEKLFDYASEHGNEYLLNDIFQLIDEQTRTPIQNPLEEILTTQTIVSSSNQTLLFCDNGKEYPVTYSAAPIVDSDDVILGMVLVMHDMTEHRENEAKLRQSQKLESLGTLSSGIAHEINNPIGIIRNFAELIKDENCPGEERLEFSEMIITECDRIATIVKNLLSFSRQQKEAFAPAKVSDIIMTTFSLINKVLGKDRILLSVDVEQDLPPLLCRFQQIQQVLMNLVTNARDALNLRFPDANEEKKMIVSARTFENQDTTWIRITVEDYGNGIPPEIASRIFDPFYTSKPRNQGTGLGLSISHGIIQDHQGELWFESEAGLFTRFHVDLPSSR